MRTTLRTKMLRCLDAYPTMERPKWLTRRDHDGSAIDPAQISILVGAVNYVAEVEVAFDRLAAGERNAMKEYNELQVKQLSDLIILTRTDLCKEDRTKVMTQITMDAHARDVIQRILVEKVSSKSAFQWQSQMKHRYLPDTGKAVICLADAVLDYGACALAAPAAALRSRHPATAHHATPRCTAPQRSSRWATARAWSLRS